MTDTLFRHEVLDAKRNSWLGGISLAQPLRLWVLTGFALLAAAAILGFLILAIGVELIIHGVLAVQK